MIPNGVFGLGEINRSYAMLKRRGIRLKPQEKVSFLGFFVPAGLDKDVKSRTRESYALMRVEVDHITPEYIEPNPRGGFSRIRQRTIGYIKNNQKDKVYNSAIERFDSGLN